MKTLLRLPVSIVKTILSIVALPIGGIFMLAVIISYQDYKSLFRRKKKNAAET